MAHGATLGAGSGSNPRANPTGQPKLKQWMLNCVFLEHDEFAFHQPCNQRQQQVSCSRLARGQKKKPRCSRWQKLLSFCIISSLRLRGSERKPVQSHSSRSALANSRVITVRFPAVPQPWGSSNPFCSTSGHGPADPSGEFNHSRAPAENTQHEVSPHPFNY